MILTKSNAKQLAANNHLSLTDMDDFDTAPTKPIAGMISQQGYVNKPASQQPKRKETYMLNDYSLALLRDVQARNTDPIHPNYRKALLLGTNSALPGYLGLKKATNKIERYNDILEQRRLFAVGLDTCPTNVLQGLIHSFKLAARTKKLILVDMIKTVMQDSTFTANIDAVTAERLEREVPSESIDNAALDALGRMGGAEHDPVGPRDNTNGTQTDDDPRTDSDTAPFGLAPEHKPDGFDTNDIELGVTGVNVWLTEVLQATLEQRDREYFAVEPLPYYKLWDKAQEKELTAQSFNEARTMLDEAFKKRISILPVNNDMLSKLDALANVA